MTAPMSTAQTGAPEDPGRVTFREYVEYIWLPSHVVEASIRQNYTYEIYRHLLPTFGTMHRGTPETGGRHLLHPPSDDVIQVHPCQGSRPRTSLARSVRSSQQSSSTGSIGVSPAPSCGY